MLRGSGTILGPQWLSLSMRVAQVFVFFLSAGFVGAFTIVASRFGESAWAVWALTMLFVTVLGKARRFEDALLRGTTGAAFAAGFFALWIKSTDITMGTTATAAAKIMVPGLMGSAALLAVVSLAALGRFSKATLGLLGLMMAGYAVALFSSSTGGPDPMMHAFMDWFGFARGQAEAWVLVLRKTIHFMFYGLVALLTWFTLHHGADGRSPNFWWAGSFALGLATFDEYRQATSVGRTGSALDVVLDAAGIACFLYLAKYSSSRKQDALLGSA